MEHEGSSPCSQEPSTIPILSHMHPIQNFPPYFLTTSFIIQYMVSSPTIRWIGLKGGPKQNNFVPYKSDTGAAVAQSL